MWTWNQCQKNIKILRLDRIRLGQNKITDDFFLICKIKSHYMIMLMILGLFFVFNQKQRIIYKKEER